MKMPLNVAAWIQFQLYLITIDRYSPESIYTSAYKLSEDPKRRWQLAVDAIYRFGVCGLMDICDIEIWKDDGIRSIEDLAKVLAQFNPADRNNSSVLNYWVAPQVIGTELCQTLIDKYDLDSYSYPPMIVCEPFIEEIEVLFQCNGVSWSDEHLIALGLGAVAQS